MSAELLVKNLPNLTTNVIARNNVGESYQGILSGEYWKVNIDKYGDYDVLITFPNRTEQKQVTVNVCKQYYIAPYDPILNNNSWDFIRYASDENIASSLWSIGDAKEITLEDGIIGTFTEFGGFKGSVYIIGFNHNASIEGNNMIHFCGFRNGLDYNGKNGIVLTDYYTRGSVSSPYYGFAASTGNIASGWKNSRLPGLLYGDEASSPSHPGENSLLAILPNDLKKVLKQCVKYTHNDSGKSDYERYVTKTEEWLFLLSEYEIFGTRKLANSFEKNYQKQYEYYKLGNTKTMYDFKEVNEERVWWTRSRVVEDSYSYCAVKGDNGCISASVNESLGLAPCFCV